MVKSVKSTVKEGAAFNLPNPELSYDCFGLINLLGTEIINLNLTNAQIHPDRLGASRKGPNSKSISATNGGVLYRL
jgi:hypothetical protein